jgi:hypothetical protein
MAEPGASEHPLMLYGGQREAAASQRAELMADPAFCKSAIEGDVGKQEMLRDLWMLERGHVPASSQPQDSADVAVQMSEREIQLSQQRVETWGKSISGFNDMMRAQIARNLATQEQHDQAVLEVRRMLSDREFGRKVLDGDMDAKDRWARWNLIAAMQVAPADYDWNNDLARFVPARSK